MRLRLFALSATLAASLVTLASADFFPAQEGNYWIFSFTRGSGGWGMGSTDSGTIRWEITSIDQMESYPVQLRIHIRQTERLLQRRVYNSGMLPDTDPYDSVYTYNPPKDSIDSLVLRGVAGVNGLWFEGDTCWSFVHDTAAAAVSGHVTLIRDTVTFGSVPYRSLRIDPAVCRSNGNQMIISCLEPDYFTCADSIGPVAYETRSSPCLMDAYWSEFWTLIGSSLLMQTAVASGAPARTGNGTRLARSSGGLAVELPAAVTGPVSVRLFDARGMLRGFTRAVRPRNVAARIPVGASTGAFIAEISDGKSMVRVKVPHLSVTR